MVRTPLSPHAGAMTTTPPPSSAESPVDDTTDPSSRTGPRVTRDEVRDLGRLRRTVDDRKVAGVAGGLARHLDIDPLILRVGFVVLAFFGGAGLILYAAGWALVPEEGRDRAPVHLDERSRTIALIALGVIAALALVGDSWGAYWFPWPLAIIGLIAFVWLSRTRDRAEQRATPPDTAGPIAAPAPTPYVAPKQRDPRKRGPILFWFTLLLVAVAEGVLGILDGAGFAGRRLGVRRSRCGRHRPHADRRLDRRPCRRPDRPRSGRQPGSRRRHRSRRLGRRDASPTVRRRPGPSPTTTRWTAESCWST